MLGIERAMISTCQLPSMIEERRTVQYNGGKKNFKRSTAVSLSPLFHTGRVILIIDCSDRRIPISSSSSSASLLEKGRFYLRQREEE